MGSIDKGTEKKHRMIPLHDFLGNFVTYLIVLTVPIGIGLCLWALEFGAIVRLFSEAFKLGYNLFGF